MSQIPQVSDLPPYLLRTEPMEVEDLPLQVALLTMEVAELRRMMAVQADLLEWWASGSG